MNVMIPNKGDHMASLIQAAKAARVVKAANRTKVTNATSLRYLCTSYSFRASRGKVGEEPELL